MTFRQTLVAMTALAGLLGPGLALAQGSAGSSMQPQTTQTTPQEGSVGGTPAARAGANAGQATGQTVPGSNAGSPQGGTAADRQTPPNMQSNVQSQGNAPAGAQTQAATPPSGNATVPPGGNAARPAAAGATTGPLAVDSAAVRSGRRASKLIGSSVYNENNESIGEVDDILLPAAGSGPVAVISVGGFLGIGAKLVAVPFDRLQAAGGSNNRWTLSGATKDSLGSLPTFNYDNSGEKRG
ncbi:PRC-barrel domain containing protein [Dankookia rubra]|uniref:PRC-barrel domain containing protein n=1 Tax=Dankookia rubra TaxID=1442381 RepID=A0A4R5Q9G3_9PROT|nr:PRC-barrel domain-containing protein [Dankookia rubra]TDH59622.1 PRC-barrel domain containing protein [Dankookia rubra]